MDEQTRHDRLPALEAWWAFAARVIGFFAGLALLAYIAVTKQGDQVYLILAAVGLIGPAVAQTVATLIVAVRSGTTEE